MAVPSSLHLRTSSVQSVSLQNEAAKKAQIAKEIDERTVFTGDADRLNEQILRGTPEDREAAIDILLNQVVLSKDSDSESLLLNLYITAGGNLLTPHEKDQLRAALGGACNRMCELVLSRPAYLGDAELPMSVAYLGAQCPSPPHAQTVMDNITTYLGKRIAASGSTSPAALVDAQQPVGHYPLLYAAQSFEHLPVHRTPLDLVPGGDETQNESMLAKRVGELCDNMRKDGGPDIQAAWMRIATGPQPLLVPIILAKSGDKIACTMLFTGDAHIFSTLKLQLESAQSDISVQGYNMQVDDKAHDANVWGHHFLRGIDLEMGKLKPRESMGQEGVVRCLSTTLHGLKAMTPDDRLALQHGWRAKTLGSMLPNTPTDAKTHLPLLGEFKPWAQVHAEALLSGPDVNNPAQGWQPFSPPGTETESGVEVDLNLDLDQAWGENSTAGLSQSPSTTALDDDWTPDWDAGFPQSPSTTTQEGQVDPFPQSLSAKPAAKQSVQAQQSQQPAGPSNVSKLPDQIESLKADIRAEPGKVENCVAELIHYAAAKDPVIAEKAQAALRDLVADPRTGNNDHNQKVRGTVGKKAWEACVKEMKGETDASKLSITVAYFGAQGDADAYAPGDGLVAQFARTHIEKKLGQNGIRVEDAVLVGGQKLGKIDVLRADRYTLADELQGASQLHKRGDIDKGAHSTGHGEFEGVLKVIHEELTGSDHPNTRFMSVNTGAHWVSLAFTRDSDKNLHCVLLDSNAQPGQEMPEQVQAALLKAGFKAGEIEPRAAPMQQDPTLCCGVLTHKLAKRIDAELAGEFSLLGSGVPGAMNGLIDKHINEWQALSPVDRKFAVLAGHAELLEAWASNKLVDHPKAS